MVDFALFNGQIYPVDQIPISFNNRAFKYGDSIFETIRCNAHYPIHFYFHYKRMIKAMLSLQMDISSFPREEELNGLIVKLLYKKKQFAASRVRIQLYRSGEGLYTPQGHKVDYLIESSELKCASYQLNEKGLLVDVYDGMKKDFNALSFFKNGNSLHYVLAAIHKQNVGLNDCLLLNHQDKIIEATSSNLFWIKDGIIYTPSVYSGCIDGVLRQVLIKLIKENMVANIVETQGGDRHMLLSADEMFLTNAIQGIQWIVGYGEKRYFNQTTRKLAQLLNDNTFHSE